MKSSLNSTKNYDLFNRSNENRPVNIETRRALKKSMEKYGWIKAYPMHVIRAKDGSLVIVDGQHRFEMAKFFSIPVWYVETDEHIDVAEVNNAQKAWNTSDYAGTFAGRGNTDYQRLIDFCNDNDATIQCGAALLAGTLSFGNVRDSFRNGTWKLKDYDFAASVCRIEKLFRNHGIKKGHRSLIDAIASCVRYKKFSEQRLTANIARCPEKIMPYSNKESMLRMIEEIYNYGRTAYCRVPLYIEAKKVMAQRNAVKK